MFNFNRLFFIRLIVSVVIIIFGIFIYIYLTNADKTDSAVKSSKEKIWTLAGIPLSNKKSVNLKVSEYGTVRPVQEVTISSLVDGEIKSILPNLREGMIVKKGEIILRIDDTNYQNKYKKTLADVKKVKALIEEKGILITKKNMEIESNSAQLKLEEQKYERTFKLKNKGILSTAKLEIAKTSLLKSKMALMDSIADYKSSKAELENLKAQMESAYIEKGAQKLDIKRCIVRSPIEGRVTVESLSKAEYITKGTPLFTIVNDEQLEIPIQLSIEDAINVFSFVHSKKDYEHWFKFAKNIPITISWSGNTKRMVWDGKIIGVEKYDEDTRTVTFIIAPVENKQPNMKNYLPLVSGMFCKVTFKGKKIKNALRVPLNAIQLNHCIYIVNNDKRLKQYPAVVIKYEDSTAVVSISKLKKAKYLIVQKLPQGITDGAKVKVIKPLLSASEKA